MLERRDAAAAPNQFEERLKHLMLVEATALSAFINLVFEEWEQHFPWAKRPPGRNVSAQSSSETSPDSTGGGSRGLPGPIATPLESESSDQRMADDK